MYNNLRKNVTFRYSFGKQRVYDTFRASGFCFNEFGFIRSDFADLMDANTENQMAAAVQRLQELRAEDPTSSKHMSFDEAVKLIRPRWCQSPAQMDRFEQYLIDTRLNDLVELKNHEDEAQRLAKEKAEHDAAVLAAVQKLSESGGDPA